MTWRGEKDVKRHRFTGENQQADGDDGIDVSMSGNERGRVVFEEPL